jgi:hypothetical protein
VWQQTHQISLQAKRRQRPLYQPQFYCTIVDLLTGQILAFAFALNIKLWPETQRPISDSWIPVKVRMCS